MWPSLDDVAKARLRFLERTCHTRKNCGPSEGALNVCTVRLSVNFHCSSIFRGGTAHKDVELSRLGVPVVFLRVEKRERTHPA